MCNESYIDLIRIPSHARTIWHDLGPSKHPNSMRCLVLNKFNFNHWRSLHLGVFGLLLLVDDKFCHNSQGEIWLLLCIFSQAFWEVFWNMHCDSYDLLLCFIKLFVDVFETIDSNASVRLNGFWSFTPNCVAIKSKLRMLSFLQENITSVACLAISK